MASKILKYAFGILLILVLIVLIRAYLHQPDAYQAKISEPIIFDELPNVMVEGANRPTPDKTVAFFMKFNRFIKTKYTNILIHSLVSRF